MADPVAPASGEYTVGFLSLSRETSVPILVDRFEKAIPRLNTYFQKLTVHDLQSFDPPKKFDAVILLHSISQGRNSITDVADAKYSKLLPRLKQTYGPHRVGVVVHSMMSYNPDTKNALMMVFKKSQPTTFNCSNCVIQCGDPAKMPNIEFKRLVLFLKEAQSHPLPSPLPPPPPPPPPTTKVSGNVPKAHMTRTTASEEHGMQSATCTAPSWTSDSISSEQPQVYSSTKISSETLDNPMRGVGSDGSTAAGTGVTSNAPEGHTKASYVTPAYEASSEATGSSARVHVPITSEHLSGWDGSNVDRTYPHADVTNAADMNASYSGHPPPIIYPVTFPPVSTCGISDIGFLDGTQDVSMTYETQSYPNVPIQQQQQHNQPCTSHDYLTYPDPNAHDARHSRCPLPGFDTTYPVALIILPKASNTEDMRVLVNLSLQGKTMFACKELAPLKKNWHLFEAILIDVGTQVSALQNESIINYTVAECKRNIRLHDNVAIIMDSQKTGSATTTCNVPEHERLWQTPVFVYNRGSGGGTIFDEGTTSRLHGWIRECNARYVHALMSSQQGVRTTGIKAKITGLLPRSKKK